MRRLAIEENIVLFVVGLPVHLDGRESQKSREGRDFGQWLGEVTGKPVEYFDERFTSAEAERLPGAAELPRTTQGTARQTGRAILLTAYLESGGKTEGTSGLDD